MTPEIRKRLTTLFHVLTRDHLPWGTLHKLIDEHALVGDGEHVYASDAGRALAEAAIGRLIGPQTSEQLEQYGVVGSALVEHTDKRKSDGSTCGLVSVNTNTCAVASTCWPAHAPRHAALPRGVSEPDWSKLCAAVGLIESVDIDDIVEVINERRNEEWYAVEALAAYCAEADPGKLSLRNVISMLESEVLRVGKRKQNQTPGNGASITVDTSICSFDDAMRQALVLAQTHIRVRLRHGCATVDVSSFDLPATLRDRWQREADHVQATRRRRGDDGRSRIAHDLRDAGFTSAGWSDSTSEIAGITLSNADASALLTSGVRLRDGKAVSS